MFRFMSRKSICVTGYSVEYCTVHTSIVYTHLPNPSSPPNISIMDDLNQSSNMDQINLNGDFAVYGLLPSVLEK